MEKHNVVLIDNHMQTNHCMKIINPPSLCPIGPNHLSILLEEYVLHLSEVPKWNISLKEVLP